MLGHWIYSLQFGLDRSDRRQGAHHFHGHTEADLAAFQRSRRRQANVRHRVS